MPRTTVATKPGPSSAVTAALAATIAKANARCAVCRNPEVAEVVRRWVAALAAREGKRIGFQLDALIPAIEKDFGVYHSRTTMSRHIHRCEPALAARASYR